MSITRLITCYDAPVFTELVYGDRASRPRGGRRRVLYRIVSD